METKRDIIGKLQKEILLMQGFKPHSSGEVDDTGLSFVNTAFPNGVFPKGALHEFITAERENAAASGGFIAGLLKALMVHDGACLWISTARLIFPPSLKLFNVEPDRIIFVDLKRDKDVLWATEEALKCDGLAAVIAELKDITFMQSRRLQLAVEKSKVTGFILRSDASKVSASTCVARWQIKPLPSEVEKDMPGVGFPRWHVELLKVRNGNPGSWKIEWSADGFQQVNEVTFKQEKRKVG
ncbi:ImuA family protein [Mucilaginibacter sp.]